MEFSNALGFWLLVSDVDAQQAVQKRSIYVSQETLLTKKPPKSTAVISKLCLRQFFCFKGLFFIHSVLQFRERWRGGKMAGIHLLLHSFTFCMG